jgi:hypothetical protein
MTVPGNPRTGERRSLLRQTQDHLSVRVEELNRRLTVCCDFDREPRLALRVVERHPSRSIARLADEEPARAGRRGGADFSQPRVSRRLIGNGIRLIELLDQLAEPRVGAIPDGESRRGPKRILAYSMPTVWSCFN